MQTNLCINPNIFHKEVFNDNIFNSLKELINLLYLNENFFFITDEKNNIEKQCLQNQENNRNQDVQKKIEIILLSFESISENKKLKIGKNLENFYIHNGKFSFLKFYNKIFKEIKCVKNFKSKSFYIISTLNTIVDKHIMPSHKHLLEKELQTTDLFKILKIYSRGIEIGNKNINNVNEEYILPIVWNAKEIFFVAGDINGEYSDNYKTFLKWIKTLLLIIAKYSEEKQIDIIIISGKRFVDDGKKNIEEKIVKELQREPKLKQKFIYNVIFHKNEHKTRHIHPRALMSNKVIVSFETVPKFEKGETKLRDKFNDITLKPTYFDKFEYLKKN